MWPQIALVAATIIGGLMSKNKNGQVSSQEMGRITADDFKPLMQIPELRELVTLQLGQARRQDAANLAKMGGLWDMLPIHVKQGTQRPGSTLATGGTGGPSLRQQGTVNRSRVDNRFDFMGNPRDEFGGWDKLSREFGPFGADNYPMWGR